MLRDEWVFRTINNPACRRRVKSQKSCSIFGKYILLYSLTYRISLHGVRRFQYNFVIHNFVIFCKNLHVINLSGQLHVQS